ncbi:MAG TPA: putative DNA-binding domain-containing protein [Gallionella sp.]|nr:putative DNA-binding domain-containing protein [Gallionella sp.]
MNKPAFQQYQAEFTGHIRAPKAAARPKGVSARGMRVYTEIVFNNMNDTLSACFPVCKKIIGARRWTKLVRAFMAEHRCTTPWFRHIPEELLRWLETSPHAIQELPPFFLSLAHYEWIELAIAVSDAALDATLEADSDLLAGRPVLVPALALLEYAWPVHRISPRFKPEQPSTTYLLLFRDAADEVRFIELNPVSARLIGLLQAGKLTGQQALDRIATEIRHPDPQAVMQFGAKLLEDLKQQGAILGANKQ